MAKTTPNRVYYKVDGVRAGRDGQVILLVGEPCDCGEEHEGAAPGCLGYPGFGCLWGAAPPSDDLSRYGSGVPLELLTVHDAVAAAARGDAAAVIDASIQACALIMSQVTIAEKDGYRKEAKELRAHVDDLRRQIALSVLVDEINLSKSSLRQIVKLDAALATDLQYSKYTRPAPRSRR